MKKYILVHPDMKASKIEEIRKIEAKRYDTAEVIQVSKEDIEVVWISLGMKNKSSWQPTAIYLIEQPVLNFIEQMKQKVKDELSK